MNNQTHTTQNLLGRVPVTVTRLNGSTEEAFVRQIRIGEYDKAYLLLNDEIGLTAFICGKDRKWLEGTEPEFNDAVTAECYEALQAKAREVNAAGFFVFVDRKQLRDQRAQEKMFAAMAQLPPEALQMAAQTGAAMQSGSTSPSPRPQTLPRSR